MSVIPCERVSYKDVFWNVKTTSQSGNIEFKHIHSHLTHKLLKLLIYENYRSVTHSLNPNGYRFFKWMHELFGQCQVFNIPSLNGMKMIMTQCTARHRCCPTQISVCAVTCPSFFLNTCKKKAILQNCTSPWVKLYIRVNLVCACVN